MEKKTAKQRFFSKLKVFAQETPWGDVLISFAPTVAEISADLACKSVVAGVGEFGLASSTKIRIKDLWGKARYNAIMAWLSGGTKAQGYGGVEGGETVLNIIHSSVRIVVQAGVETYGFVYNYRHK